jgi:acetylornithine deacetylase/succinyl-diaminopimelate desuccinylase-like protein
MCPKLLKEIEEEITGLLSGLLRIDTTNPPGNETKAAKYLAKDLEKDGFKCDLFESALGRGSVVTRLKGTGKKPNLLLLSHLDVVAANPKEWSVDPFGGVVKDDFVWGRGALDMKSMTAMETIVIKLLKRNKVKLKGDVILAATADEERGGEAGAGWLARNHPEKVKADYSLNEGGGLAIPIGKKNIYTIQTSEKGIYWFRVRAKGRPGHGSIPSAADNAIMRMNKVIDKLGNHRSKIILTPTVRDNLRTLVDENKLVKEAALPLLKNPDSADQILDMLAQQDKTMAEEIRARLRMTVTPTIIHGGVKENIIPSECEAVFDCRMLPGQTPETAMEEIKGLLKDVDLDKLEFETIQANEPSESPSNTALYKLIVDTLKEFEPNCSVMPVLLTGGTDSRFFRHQGTVAYGFQPLRADMPYGEMIETIHGIDERVSIKNLVFGTSVLYNVVERFMT